MKWKLQSYDSEYLKKMSSEFSQNVLITELLLNRGFRTKKEVDIFLNPTSNNLHDPFLFEDMKKAVSRLIKAKNNKEKIMIYGDYDVDGLSGTAYLIIMLRNIGLDVDYYIPNRVHEGVGINKNLIKYLMKKKVKLFITVDTGLKNNSEVENFKRHGIDIIITDHHRQIETIKSSNVCIINPKVSKKYPNKDLSGAGVAFKFATAIYDTLNLDKKILYNYLDIVMIGTVADVVPMIDENRYIIKKGLEKLKNTKVKGLKYILNYLKINSDTVTASDIGFNVAPIVNALGRVDSSKKVVDFFIQEDYYYIFSIIEDMKEANKKRRMLEIKIYDEIEEKIKKLHNPKYIFMKSRKWHSGVIGVVCSRLSIKYNIPVILVSIKNGYGKASCRSIEGINIFNILKEISDKYERFGGHDLASGFLVKEDKLYEVEKYLKNRLYSIKRENIIKTLDIDIKFKVNNLHKGILKKINLISPFGLKNDEPNFLDTDVVLFNYNKFGVENRHFKGFIKKNNKIISVVGYNLSHKLKNRTSSMKIDIVYTPISKTVYTETFIELKIKDFQIK